jgi:hypothetical protein
MEQNSGDLPLLFTSLGFYGWSAEGLRTATDDAFLAEELERAADVLDLLRSRYSRKLRDPVSVQQLQQELGWRDANDIRRAVYVLAMEFRTAVGFPGRTPEQVQIKEPIWDATRELLLKGPPVRLRVPMLFVSGNAPRPPTSAPSTSDPSRRSAGMKDQDVVAAQPDARNATATKIFLSHASLDADLAKALIDLIEAGVEARTGHIRCTSVPGYKLDGGDRAPDVLRQNLEACGVVVGILTKKSVSSSYVLMELGAAWAFRKRAILLVGPGASFGDLPGPFRDVHALHMADESDMAGLNKTIAAATGLPETGNGAKVQVALKALSALVSASSTPASEVSARAPFLEETRAPTAKDLLTRRDSLRRLLDEGRVPIVVPRLSGLTGNELSAECENVGSVAASNVVAYEPTANGPAGENWLGHIGPGGKVVARVRYAGGLGGGAILVVRYSTPSGDTIEDEHRLDARPGVNAHLELVRRRLVDTESFAIGEPDAPAGSSK